MKPWRVALAAAALFGLHLFWNMLSGIGAWDEAFALRVVDRVRGGEVLYRDVFFGATPLGVYLGRAATLALGVELGAIKVACAACFTASALLASRLAWQLTGSWAAAPILIGLQLVLGPCDPRGLYTPLADALLLAAATLAIDRRFAVAGLFAGLCFATKQNTGLYALGAVLLSQWIGERDAWSPRRAAPVLEAFAAPVLGILAPVVVQGALPALVDLGFTGKHHYLARGGISYAVGLGEWWQAVGAPLGERGLAPLFQGQVFLLPGVALVLALAAARRLPRATLAFVPFVAAALGVVFPRADLRHLASAVPALGVLAIAAWHVLPRASPRRALAGGAGAWLAVGLGSAWLPMVMPWARGDRVGTGVAHLGGALLSREQAAGIRDLAASLEALSGQEVFFATPRASLLYLLSGARNPTRFDWPGVTSMGGAGEQSTIESIRAGRIAAACVEPAAWELAPLALEQAIAEAMPLATDLGPCRLHRRR